MGSKDDDEVSTRTTIIITTGIVALFVGGPVFGALGWPYLHGATPAQILDEPLERSPKQLAKDLPASASDKTSARVNFKKGAAGEYERVDFDWASGTSDAPNAMRLRAEHGAKGDDAKAALTRRLHALDDGRFRWGPVRIRADDDGDVRFSVDREIDGKPNPLFERQVEAAKEVVLNAAFDLPLRVSDKELADVLGTGYSPAALATFDVETPVEKADAAVRVLAPAAIASGSSSWKVPLDHPLVTKVSLSWRNQANGRLSGVYLTTSKQYAGRRAAFEQCVEKQLGPPAVDVTDYAGGRKDYKFRVGSFSLRLSESSVDVSNDGRIDATSFATLFRALDACRDGAETGAATK